MKKALLWIPLGLLLAAGVFLIGSLIRTDIISGITREYEAHCAEVLADVYEVRDCAEYGLSELSMEIVDCVFCHDIIGKRYIATLQVDCTSHMDLNDTQKSLLAYAVLDQLPEKFTTSTGKQVTLWDNGTDAEYKGRMVYISVNGKIMLKPEVITKGPDVIYCPTCGTGWNARHPAGKYVRQTGRCGSCPG